MKTRQYRHEADGRTRAGNEIRRLEAEPQALTAPMHTARQEGAKSNKEWGVKTGRTAGEDERQRVRAKWQEWPRWVRRQVKKNNEQPAGAAVALE